MVTAADPVQWQRPADADGGVIVSQPRLMTRLIGSIHEVKKVSLISESLMPVGNSIRNAQAKPIGIAQFKSEMLKHRRRPFPHVDYDIPHGTVNASHDLGLMNAKCLIMHATNRSFAAAFRQVGLRYMKGKSRVAKL